MAKEKRATVGSQKSGCGPPQELSPFMGWPGGRGHESFPDAPPRRSPAGLVLGLPPICWLACRMYLNLALPQPRPLSG